DHADAEPAVGVDEGGGGAVEVDGAGRRVAGVGVERELGQEALRLAQRIAHEDASTIRGGVGAPPVEDVSDDLARGAPAVDGETERGFCNERAAGDDLERRGGGIWGALVVAGEDPDVA